MYSTGRKNRITLKELIVDQDGEETAQGRGLKDHEKTKELNPDLETVPIVRHVKNEHNRVIGQITLKLTS